MTLEELLDELRTNVLRDTSTAVTASEADNLWTDATLVRYINEGYFQFARRTQLLRDDATPAVTQLTLVQDVGRYKLDRRVLSVQSVHLSDGTPLIKSTHPTLFFEPANVARATTGVPNWQPGRPSLYTVDTAMRILRIRGTPSAAMVGEVLQMRVTRLPLEPLCIDDLQGEPEIPGDYQLDMLEWAAFRALRNHDTDGENLRKASAHKTRFMQAVEEVLTDNRRQMFTPIQFQPNAHWD